MCFTDKKENDINRTRSDRECWDMYSVMVTDHMRRISKNVMHSLVEEALNSGTSHSQSQKGDKSGETNEK